MDDVTVFPWVRPSTYDKLRPGQSSALRLQSAHLLFVLAGCSESTLSLFLVAFRELISFFDSCSCRCVARTL